MRAAVVALIACGWTCALACQGKRGDAPPREPAQERGSALHDPPTTATGDASELPEHPVEPPRSKPDEAEPTPDPGKAIADLGAMPAWQAVVDRARYLARRNQHAIVYGTLASAAIATPVPAPIPHPAPAAPADAAAPPPPTDAAAASPYLWLVDDTEGNGALAIRVGLGSHAAKPGDRVALGGAWMLDADRRWYWKVDAVTQLAAVPATTSVVKEPPALPGHAIANGELPAGAHTISVAKDNELAYFTVVGTPPAIDGDGWAVADELGNPVYALLNLPGERASYGAQDLRTADERWQLRRGATYWLRIGRIHKHGAGKPVTINARTAPVRVK